MVAAASGEGSVSSVGRECKGAAAPRIGLLGRLPPPSLTRYCSAFPSAPQPHILRPPPCSLTRYGPQYQSTVLDGVRQRPNDVEGGGVGNQARAGHTAVRRLETNNTAEVRRLADASSYSVEVWR